LSASPSGGGGGVAVTWYPVSGSPILSAANTFTYTVNVSQCLKSLGSTAPLMKPGEELDLGFMAVPSSPGAPDNTAQFIHFERQ
jgi:hypothetical protein